MAIKVVAAPIVAVGMAKMGVDKFKKKHPPTEKFAFPTDREFEPNEEITINFPEGRRTVRCQGFKISNNGPCPAETIPDRGSFTSRQPAFLYSSPYHRTVTKLFSHKEFNSNLTVYYSEEPIDEDEVRTDGGTNPEGQPVFGDKLFKHPKLKSYSQQITPKNDPGIIGTFQRAFEEASKKQASKNESDK